MDDVTPYQVQYAKSGRAECKNPKCKKKIEKGSMKVLTETSNGEYNIQRGYHPQCFNLPRNLKKQGVTVETFVDEYLVDTSDDGDILTNERLRRQLISDLEAAADPKSVPGPKKEGGSNAGGGGADDDDGGDTGGAPTLMDRLKKAAMNVQAPPNDDDDDDDDHDDSDSKPPAAKKIKTEDDGSDIKPLAATSASSGPKAPKEDFDDMLAVYHQYSKIKVDELKDYLRWNMQTLKGTKQFILFKVLDGHVNGRLGLCPLCQGQLKYEEVDYDRLVHCSGRYDEDIGQRIACSYKVGRLDSKCPRVHPWYSEQPSEEEMEEMQKVKDEARGEGEGGDYVDQPVAAELLKSAADLQLNLDTIEGKKDAAAKYVALVEGKLDLPEGRNATMEVGRIVMSNLDQSPRDIMQSIITKFGIKEVKHEKAAMKEAAAEAACANPKNAGLLLAFRECAKYYFEEGNRNAGSSYVKAISTLMELEEEVTAENAMGFSKGKTKLPGIGKGTAEKMLEFVKTGTFAKLEEKRAAHS